VECKPLSADDLVRWIKARLKARGMEAPQAGIALIADSAQGNLLAAAQAVERLTLLGAQGVVTLDAVREAAVDEARYGLFELADAALAGDGETALRILVRLRETGTASAQVLWVLARDLRLLASLAWARDNGATAPRIWPPSRTQLVTDALRRRRVRGWQALVVEAANIDRVIKGRASGDAWQRLERLLFAMAGARAKAAA
ncbi:MAG: DNA polymerase III subunit delta, partial [Gammaproteobacteria bacterium]